MDHSNPAPVLFLAAVPMALVLNVLYPYLCDVRLGATDVEIVALKRIVVWAIPRDEIIRFDKVSFLEGAFAFHIPTRLFGQRVLLTRDRGLIRRISVTPRDAEQFCNAFREQWASANESATRA
jgi:hypothetical protein